MGIQSLYGGDRTLIHSEIATGKCQLPHLIERAAQIDMWSCDAGVGQANLHTQTVTGHGEVQLAARKPQHICINHPLCSGGRSVGRNAVAECH